jgi:peptide/nickel transport system permease protein
MIRGIILRRVGIGVLLLWLVSIIIFLVIHILPGNAAVTLLGRDATPYTMHLLTKQLGLDQPVLTQYWHWLSTTVTGHWGNSLITQFTVANLVGTRVQNTAVLVLFTMVIAFPLALLIGAYTATRSGKLSDTIVSIVTLVTAAVPGFAIAIFFVFFFAANVFHIFPAASIINTSIPIWSQLKYCLLPTIVLVFVIIPYSIRMARANVIDVLGSDYVMLARLKGLPERQVLLRHAVRNCLAPIIQVGAHDLIFLAGGVVLVETVFSYPGIGYALVQAVNGRDIPVVQMIVLLVAAVIVVINLLADLAIIMVTPKLRSRA